MSVFTEIFFPGSLWKIVFPAKISAKTGKRFKSSDFFQKSRNFDKKLKNMSQNLYQKKNSYTFKKIFLQNVTKLKRGLDITLIHNKTNFYILCIIQCWEIASPNLCSYKRLVLYVSTIFCFAFVFLSCFQTTYYTSSSRDVMSHHVTSCHVILSHVFSSHVFFVLFKISITIFVQKNATRKMVSGCFPHHQIWKISCFEGSPLFQNLLLFKTTFFLTTWRIRDLASQSTYVVASFLGVWHGVAMDSLKYRYGLPCPTLPHPAGSHP
jgi:hypothetical protein